MNKILRNLGTPLLVGLIASCGPSMEEIEASWKAEDEQKCLEYGFKQNTDGFRLCMQNEANVREQEANAYSVANTQRLLQGYRNSY